jgi:hypothetical protein
MAREGGRTENARNGRKDEEGRGREGRKGERRWDKKPIAGTRHSPHEKKPPNHRHRTATHQANGHEGSHRTQASLLRGQTLPRKPAEVPAPDIGYEQEAHHSYHL